jgi:hypothetical protein
MTQTKRTFFHSIFWGLRRSPAPQAGSPQKTGQNYNQVFSQKMGEKSWIYRPMLREFTSYTQAHETLKLSYNKQLH